MDLLLLLTYTAICVVIFKVFRVPMNKWSIPTAGLGGVVLIGTLMLLMNYNHPHSSTAVYSFITTPIVPNVRGQVTEVKVASNKPIKKGDLLFQIDPTPFEDVVQQRAAAVMNAESRVEMLKESLERTESAVSKAVAARDQAEQSYQRYQVAGQTGGAAAIDIENRKQRLTSAQATVDMAESSRDSARLELDNQVNSIVPEARGALERAEFDLRSTSVHAPADGYVAQMFLRPGMMVTPLPMRPAMVFVQQEKPYLVANFRQNSLQRLESGFEAEVMFKSVPGKVFKAEVVHPLGVLAEGELQSSGRLVSASELVTSGLAPVVVTVTDERFSQYFIPFGVSAEVAVYSDHLHHVALIRKVLLRMKSWQNFLYFDH